MFIRKIVTGGILAMLCAPFTAGDGCAAIVVGGVLGAFCASGGVARANTTASYPAVAKPWRDVNLSFSRPGRVVRILVRRGQVVKAGQLLAQENDPQQKIAAQLAKLTAEHAADPGGAGGTVPGSGGAEKNPMGRRPERGHGI